MLNDSGLLHLWCGVPENFDAIEVWVSLHHVQCVSLWHIWVILDYRGEHGERIAAGHKETWPRWATVTRHTLPSLCWANEWMQASEREYVIIIHTGGAPTTPMSTIHLVTWRLVRLCRSRCPRTCWFPDESSTIHYCPSTGHRQCYLCFNNQHKCHVIIVITLACLEGTIQSKWTLLIELYLPCWCLSAVGAWWW